jgi:hypothetical protein
MAMEAMILTPEKLTLKRGQSMQLSDGFATRPCRAEMCADYFNKNAIFLKMATQKNKTGSLFQRGGALL